MASLRSSFDFFHFLRLFHFPTNFFRFLKFPNLSHPHETPTLGAERGRKQPTLEQNRRKNLPCTYPAPTYPRAAGHIRGSLAVRTTFRSPPGGETREGAYPGAYPGATLELPWSGRAPEKRPHRRGSRVGAPLWTWPDIPLRPSSPSVPSTLPPFHPPPPARPKAPGSHKNPPPTPTLELPLDPRRAPLGGLRPDGRPGPPGLGSWSNSHFPQKHFLWEIRQIDSRPREGRRGKKAEGITYPRAPTLELDTGLPYTSSRRERSKSNQTKPNAPGITPTRRSRRSPSHWGNRGEVRLTLSRS
jgi:hypothetical protein